MGPRNAATLFLDLCNNQAARFEVTLYGSLAATGRGHLTDKAILDVLTPAAHTDILWKPDTFLPFHPNGMKFRAFDSANAVLQERTWYSVGGGDIVLEGESRRPANQVYRMHTIEDILNWCDETGRSFWEYVDMCEGPSIWDYLREVWEVMKAAVERGVEAEGVLPGGLGVRRKAVSYYVHAAGYNASLKSRGLVYAYALGVSEENASGGKIVTAPTCGSCGVLPAVLYHLYTSKNFTEQRVLRALATAGLFGNVVKTNASISGAEVGCQGEVGVACAMAAAAASQLFGGTPAQIEYSAEMGLEHHLGLTCDPVCGLVQIPCIERNAYAAARALDANLYAAFSDGRHSVKFDRIVEVMKQTGHDLPSIYKETSKGGLAAIQ
jgi:L-serine dehydratase